MRPIYNVRTDHFAYLDSDIMTIRPERVMPSGALPDPNI
jgi:hypothetical protein